MDYSVFEIKKAIVRVKNQNKFIREIVKILRVSKSTILYILKKKEWTSELRNVNRHRNSMETTVVDDTRNISLVKKNPFTEVDQINNPLQNIYEPQNLGGYE